MLLLSCSPAHPWNHLIPVATSKSVLCPAMKFFTCYELALKVFNQYALCIYAHECMHIVWIYFTQHFQIKICVNGKAETSCKCSLPTSSKLTGNNINSAVHGK